MMARPSLEDAVTVALDPWSGDLYFTGKGPRRLRFTRTAIGELARQQWTGPLGPWATGDDVVLGVPDDAIVQLLHLATRQHPISGKLNLLSTQIILVWEHPSWAPVEPTGVIPEQPVVYDIGYTLGGDAADGGINDKKGA